MAVGTKQGYSGLQITLHWLIALLVLFQLIFGESMTNVVDALEENQTPDPTDQTLASAHYWVGIAILVLAALRIVIRLVQGAPEPVGAGLQLKAAKAIHAIFYLLLIAVPVTGLLAVYVSPEIGDIHEIGKPLFIAFIVLHALGALYHHFMVKDDTLRRMFAPR
ncbi:cytochrome b [Dongia rigui]|uniref:Cytochrome b n=1 Tax=Dongia rigui TaxID=940149 RepID=A0ABU5E3V5_9PROT|nr:cytochrome b [Dongia rigui]MDY0874092.1 cytochrome b [Dongia rigui]